MKRTFLMVLIVLTIGGCNPDLDDQLEIVDQRQEMLDVMDFTARAVSEILVHDDVRQEILGYGLKEFDGEVTAHFSRLLVDDPIAGVANINSQGTFSRLFGSKARQFKNDVGIQKSQAAGSLISDLEAYLKEHNMALYGPYLAENHANSSKPVTVSFDPLDNSKESNFGYMFVPKSTNSESSTNNESLDAPPITFDNYELKRVDDIDDQYAYDNPVLVVVPDNELGTFTPSSGLGQQSQSDKDINCSELLKNDILRPYMVRFRLTNNLRSGFWNRNLLNMYAVTKDDIKFDINNVASINTSVAKVWNRVQVSRKNARKKKWMDTNQMLDSNWKTDEDNLLIAVSYKKGKVQVGEIKARVKGIFAGQLSTTVNASLKFEEHQELLFFSIHDKCDLLARYKTASTTGLENGLRVEKGGGKMEYTFGIEWYR